MAITLRTWQENAVKTITQALKTPNSKIAINAGVGSGKTYVPFEAIVQFIKNLKNKNQKTFHTFVCPRIRLCKQQALEAEKLFNARGIKNVSVRIWNSDSNNKMNIGNKMVDNNSPFWDSNSQHILCVICDESLWGVQNTTDKHGKPKKISRYDRFENMLMNNIKFNRINGIIAYDEAHNYKQKQNFMFGQTISKNTKEV